LRVRAKTSAARLGGCRDGRRNKGRPGRSAPRRPSVGVVGSSVKGGRSKPVGVTLDGATPRGSATVHGLGPPTHESGACGRVGEREPFSRPRGQLLQASLSWVAFANACSRSRIATGFSSPGIRSRRTPRIWSCGAKALCGKVSRSFGFTMPAARATEVPPSASPTSCNAFDRFSKGGLYEVFFRPAPC
jgi:hypothetical protein